MKFFENESEPAASLRVACSDRLDGHGAVLIQCTDGAPGVGGVPEHRFEHQYVEGV